MLATLYRSFCILVAVFFLFQFKICEEKQLDYYCKKVELLLLLQILLF